MSSQHQLLPTTSQILEILDCPICLQVPEPPIWLCCSGHSLCQKCRARLLVCPICQGPFSSARNWLAEQIVKALRPKCPYFCEESLMGVKELERHVQLCHLRPLECNMMQKRGCCGSKVDFSKYFHHLKSSHDAKGIKGTHMNVTQLVTTEQAKLCSEMPFGMWPIQYMEACNEVFLTGTSVSKGTIFWWLYLIGSEPAASKYMTAVKLTVKNKTCELCWTGPVHSIRTTPAQILREGLCLIATPESLKPFTYHQQAAPTTSTSSGKVSSSLNVGWNLSVSVMKKDRFLSAACNKKTIPTGSDTSQQLEQPTVKNHQSASMMDLTSSQLGRLSVDQQSSSSSSISSKNVALSYLPGTVVPGTTVPGCVGSSSSAGTLTVSTSSTPTLLVSSVPQQQLQPPLTATVTTTSSSSKKSKKNKAAAAANKT